MVTKDDTAIVEGGGARPRSTRRAAQLRREIEESDSDWDREKLQERLAKLSGGVAVIKVGAATETALKERKGRIEDAVAASRAAVEEGIVPGGGVALVHAADSVGDLGMLGDEALGVAIVRAASAAPVRWIANNAGVEGSVVVAKVRDLQWGHGFDAEEQTYCDLVAAGIVDPVKVTRSAIVNAASIARMIISYRECDGRQAGAGTPGPVRVRATATGTARGRSCSCARCSSTAVHYATTVPEPPKGVRGPS